jgi:glyoxylase-like metal-dependent hydrolase (beta-lactamase superfamily II)
MAVELRPGVWRVGLRGVNAYLVEDDDGLALVDTGMPWQADSVRRALEVAGFSMRDVDRVLLTHYDVDHVGGLQSLLSSVRAADGDVEICCGEGDAGLVVGNRKPPLSVPKGLGQRLGRMLTPSVDSPVRALGDGDRVGGFEAVATPGHTPGHVAYVHEELDAALLGDLVRENDGRLEPSPWLLSSDTGELEPSVRRVLDRAPAFEAACVGHGDPIRSGGRDALAAVLD